MATINFTSFATSDWLSPRIGHYDIEKGTIQPLSFLSGTPISTLYQVIEAGENRIKPYGDPIAAASATILAPITGRDILAVGKNYFDHAKEFNSSGFDSSDKVDVPSHPVIFTKRATSIIANGEQIYPHPGFTETLDYEGEIGVIIGKAGFRVSEEDAPNYVWGYTIINDMTARERQRDHKQFYIGKSPDTFCPIGPIAVQAKHCPKVLEIQTHVNGELRQHATSEDLIFSIPHLIKTISEGQTIRPGDVIATGTPAGVGIGKQPPIFLQPGDEITVSVSGLGSLSNKIAPLSSSNYTTQCVENESSILFTNAEKAVNGSGLSKINGKNLFYQNTGASGKSSIVFVHGLGGTSEYWKPLVQELGLEESHALHFFDLEGHGLSPTSPLSALSISSFAADLKGVFDHVDLNESSDTTVFAHSMGCLVALSFAISHPQLAKRLVLLGPPPSPLPEAASSGSYARAHLARTKGMIALVDAVASAGTSSKTKTANKVALAAVRLSLLSQNPEGYAKACAALAGATDALPIENITAQTLLITGDEDKISPPDLNSKYSQRLQNSGSPVVLSNVGHWHGFEDVSGVAQAVSRFLSLGQNGARPVNSYK